MTYIEHYLHSLHLETIMSHIISKVVSLILLLILFGVAKKILNVTFSKAVEKSIPLTKQTPMRQRTLTKLLHNLMNYTLYFLLVYWVLSILGIPVSSLLAGAGIAGVAVGLGAQGFLSDVVKINWTSMTLSKLVVFREQFLVLGFEPHNSLVLMAPCILFLIAISASLAINPVAI